MNPAEVKRELTAERRGVEMTLRRLLKEQKGIPVRLKQAMAHSVLSGGKRLRPVLLLWTWDALASGGKHPPVNRQAALECACALEMLHTYSLIHDDLPAMDDDVLRRGRPTCHVAFDEPTAILAGDGLQALAFEILAGCAGTVAGPLVARVAHAVGPAGMVGGQQLDLDGEGQPITGRMVAGIHRRKTACLLAVAMTGGALLAGANTITLERIEAAGLDLGLAFQGADDVLDVTADTATLGKTVGKDEAAGKATWIRVEGLSKARARTERTGGRGLRKLAAAVPDTDLGHRLLGLGDLMWQRDR